MLLGRGIVSTTKVIGACVIRESESWQPDEGVNAGTWCHAVGGVLVYELLIQR
jgi:hypothetical protein